MPANPHPSTFGVFKPVDHVVLPFASAAETNAAAQTPSGMEGVGA